MSFDCVKFLTCLDSVSFDVIQNSSEGKLFCQLCGETLLVAGHESKVLPSNRLKYIIGEVTTKTVYVANCLCFSLFL